MAVLHMDEERGRRGSLVLAGLASDSSQNLPTDLIPWDIFSGEPASDDDEENDGNSFESQMGKTIQKLPLDRQFSGIIIVGLRCRVLKGSSCFTSCLVKKP